MATIDWNATCGTDQFASMSVDLKKSLLIEVAAPRPAEGETPAKGPTLRINLAKNGYSKLENATTLFELWQRRCAGRLFAAECCV